MPLLGQRQTPASPTETKPNNDITPTKLPNLNVVTKPVGNPSPLSQNPVQMPAPFIKRESLPRLKTSQKRKPKPKYDFSHLATASFDELNRLTSLVDEQKTKIAKLNKEIKTLQNVILRQDKALVNMDKEKGEFPYILKSMNEEVRVLRAEKHKYCEKAAAMERQYHTQGEEMTKLNDRIMQLQAKLKTQEHQDVAKLQKQINVLETTNKMLTSDKENLEKQVKQINMEKNREVTFARHQMQKTAKELEQVQQQVLTYQSRLRERERQVNALSIYSQYSDTERSISPRRQGKAKRYKSPPPITEASEYSEAPIVDVKLESTKDDKSVRSEKDSKQHERGRSEPTNVPQASFHKPQFSVFKSPSRSRTVSPSKRDAKSDANSQYASDFE
ncbi:ciliary protein causing Leber congenital amaurosis disease-domain-containing protein [Gorgonomyces haynaldii]|nr:ciliary protein causing Leber congenital amaurosis disease-domain-containing protein [Gorgonomyces haynaldii]